jgi:hypothetical protein
VSDLILAAADDDIAGLKTYYLLRCLFVCLFVLVHVLLII